MLFFFAFCAKIFPGSPEGGWWESAEQIFAGSPQASQRQASSGFSLKYVRILTKRFLGAVAPSIKTKAGWILLYHGVSDDNVYRVGAVLLDLKNPIKIIGRTSNPILEPETSYEKEGLVPNVVFPCGAVALGEKLFVYYGGGDRVVGLATIKINKLLRVLKLCRC